MWSYSFWTSTWSNNASRDSEVIKYWSSRFIPKVSFPKLAVSWICQAGKPCNTDLLSGLHKESNFISSWLSAASLLLLWPRFSPPGRERSDLWDLHWYRSIFASFVIFSAFRKDCFCWKSSQTLLASNPSSCKMIWLVNSELPSCKMDIL